MINAGDKIIIAVDGYSSTGKSTFAKIVAAGLGYVYVDTGAVYRAITYFAYTNGFMDGDGNIDVENLGKIINRIRINFKFNELLNKSETFLNGVNVEAEIRSMSVSDKVSAISELPSVRSYVDVLLRKLGEGRGVVMDGRDIGSVVFPDAELKIFMTADPAVRAERRRSELVSQGRKVTYEEVFENLKKRDFLDSHRTSDPLVKAEDAVVLDNTNMTIEDELSWIGEILKDRFNMKLK
ncbi:MAG: (d)CMP kinase [Bacteroidales bacterium]|jgi:cytidylate kinase|nr:(d)CMP kinase [Bacteroidales bacterium]